MKLFYIKGQILKLSFFENFLLISRSNRSIKKGNNEIGKFKIISMAEEGFAWIYLVFFLIIPLSRILPRAIRKLKEKGQRDHEPITQRVYQPVNESITESPQNSSRVGISKEMQPPTLDMLVLGELNRGTKNFDSIQKNLGIDGNTLDKTLQKLEEQGLMEVQNKQSLTGPKIELILTEKGFKKFYS